MQPVIPAILQRACRGSEPVGIAAVTHFVALDRLPIEFCDACPIDALPYSELTMHPQGSRGNWGLGSPALDAEGDDGGFGSALDGWLKTPGVHHPWGVAGGFWR
jgi:hypothetical protein